MKTFVWIDHFLTCPPLLVTGLLGPQWDAAQPLIAVLACTCVSLPFSWAAVTVLSARGLVQRVLVSHAIAAAIKVSALLIVRHTRDLTLITMMVAVVAAEATMFIWQLWHAGNLELRSLATTILRAVVSIVVTCGDLSPIPGTWAHVGLNRAYALLVGSMTGVLTFMIFFASQFALWVLCDKPSGAEDRIVGLLNHDPRVRRFVQASCDSVNVNVARQAEQTCLLKKNANVL